MQAQKLADVDRRIGSKIEDAQATADTAIAVTRENKEELAKVKAMTLDTISCTHAAIKATSDLALKFDRLGEKFEKVWIPIVIGSAGSTIIALGGIAGLLKLMGKW